MIGDDGFLDQVDDAVVIFGERRTLSKLISECCERYQVTGAQLSSPARTRRYSKVRARIAAAAQWEGVATLREIALHFNRSDNAISRSLIRLREEFPRLSPNKLNCLNRYPSPQRVGLTAELCPTTPFRAGRRQVGRREVSSPHPCARRGAP